MKTIAKIALIATTGLGLTLWLRTQTREEDDCGCQAQKDRVKKIIGGNQEDNYSVEEPLNRQIIPYLESERYLKDFARWGTEEGVMDVADLNHLYRSFRILNAVQQGRIKSLGIPTHLKVLDKYARDLERWGTKEGIIDVSNDEGAKRKKKELLKRMGKQGKAVTTRYLKAKKKELQHKGKKVTTRDELLDELKKDYEVTQITIRNTSDEERPVSLWEGNRSNSVSPPKPTDVNDHTVVEELAVDEVVHPQGMAVNPFNGYTYIANQLTNNVSVIDTEGQVIRLVQLEPSAFPGYNSPVDVAVNTNQNSPNYGMVYVIGSVSNTVSVINPDFQVIENVTVGTRPLSVTYNPITDKLYVSNYVDSSLSIIDTLTYEQERIAIGTHPLGIGVNTHTGEVLVANSSDNSISVVDIDNTLVATINNVGDTPTNLAYHPETRQLFIVSSGNNEVVTLDASNYLPLESAPVGADPYAIEYNENNAFMYVVGRADNTITVLNKDAIVNTTLDLPQVGNGFAINQTKNLLFTSSNSTSFINVIGFEAQSSAIEIDQEYEEKRVDFQHNPVMVSNAKFIISDNQNINVMRLREGKSTGSSTVRTLSFNNSKSPQHLQNVTEMSGMEGAVIDGSVGWDFKIAPKQTITLLIQHRQFDLYHLLPQSV